MKYLAFISLCIAISLQLIAQTQSTPPKIINFKKLQEFLPVKAPEGFTQGKPKGQTTSTSGFSSSSAAVEFNAPKKEKQLQTMDDGKQDSVEVDVTWTVNVEIFDYAGMGEGMSASLQMLQGMQFENETENGYEKSTTYKNYKGIEKSSTQEYSRSCSIQLVVGDRFVVNANGNGFADVTILHKIFDAMDLKKLESAQ